MLFPRTLPASPSLGLELPPYAHLNISRHPRHPSLLHLHRSCRGPPHKSVSCFVRISQITTRPPLGQTCSFDFGKSRGENGRTSTLDDPPRDGNVSVPRPTLDNGLDSAAGRWRCNHCNPLWQPRFPPNPKSSSLEGISGPPLLHRRRSRVVKDLGRDFDSRGMQTCRGSNPPPMPLCQMLSASISTETGLVFEGRKRHAMLCMSSLLEALIGSSPRRLCGSPEAC